MASPELYVQRLPGFTADETLDRGTKERYYGISGTELNRSIVVPAAPCCSQCHYVCEKCATCQVPPIDPHPDTLTLNTPSYFHSTHNIPPYCRWICQFCARCYAYCNHSC